MSIFAMDSFKVGGIAARAAYFEGKKPNQNGADDYYFQSNDTLATNFVGRACHVLELGDAPQEGDYKALFEGRNPRTGEVFIGEDRAKELEEKEDTVAGYSSSFNLDKSLSLFYAKLNKEQQALMERSIIEAVNATVQYMEDNDYVNARTGKGGKGPKERASLLAASYLHFTNRDQEPHLHAHLEIANSVYTESGKWRALNASEIYKRQAEIRAVFDVALAEFLKQNFSEISAHLQSDFTGYGLEVAGIPEEMIDANSSRRQAILSQLEGTGLSGAAAKKLIALASRDAKGEIDPEELRQLWREEFKEIVLADGDNTPPSLIDVESVLFKSRSIFMEHDLDRVAAQLSINRGGLDSIAHIKGELIRQMGIVPIEHKEKPGQYYTTHTMVEFEAGLLRYVLSEQKHNRFALSHKTIEKTVAQLEKTNGRSFTDEQRTAFEMVAGRGHGFAIIEGAAGTGKSTTALLALKTAYEAAGHRVIGMAPSGAAMAELQKSIGLSGAQCGTVHSMLIKHQNANGQKFGFQQGDVIILDEAGTLDTRTFHALAKAAQESGAMLIATGDRKQMEAVGSASTFGMLGDELGHSNVAWISEIKRQREAYQPIAQAFFSGGKGQAWQMMHDAGLVEYHTKSKKDPDSQSPFEAAVKAYLAQVTEALENKQAGQSTADIYGQYLMLADSNADVRRLNDLIRQARIERGEIEQGEQIKTQFGRQYFAAGDRVMFRKNSKVEDEDENETRVFNGNQGEVLAVEMIEGEEAAKLTIRLDRGDVVSIDSREYPDLMLSYAMTVYKSQGLTVEQAFYVLDPNRSNRRSAYVAYTRGRNGARFYAANSEDAQKDLNESMQDIDAKLTALAADENLLEKIKERFAAEHGQAAIFTQEQLSVLQVMNDEGPRWDYGDGEENAQVKQEPAAAGHPQRDIQVVTHQEAEQLADIMPVLELFNDAEPEQLPALPAGNGPVALAAEPLPPQLNEAEFLMEREAMARVMERFNAMPTEQREPALTEIKSMRERHMAFEEIDEVQRIKQSVDLVQYAERFGYRVTEQAAGYTWMKRGESTTIGIRTFEGDQLFYEWKGGQEGKGGDIFTFHQTETGDNFGQARKALRAFAGLKAPQAPQVTKSPDRVMKEAAKDIREQAVDEKKLAERLTRRAAAYAAWQQASKDESPILASRGISEETLSGALVRAAPGWHKNALFPHVNEEGKFCGYEVKGHKGYTGFQGCKGIYIVNRQDLADCEEIVVCESGLDALSRKQLDAQHGQAAGRVYVSIGGTPSSAAADAIARLAKDRNASVSLELDNDDAGNTHTDRMASMLEQREVDEIQDNREQLAASGCKDWNQVVQDVPDEQIQQLYQEHERSRQRSRSRGHEAEM